MDRFIGKNSPVLTFKISLDSSEMFFLLEGFKKGGGGNMQTIAVCRLTRKAGLAIISRYVRFPDEEHNSHTIRNKRMKVLVFSLS